MDGVPIEDLKSRSKCLLVGREIGCEQLHPPLFYFAMLLLKFFNSVFISNVNFVIKSKQFIFSSFCTYVSHPESLQGYCNEMRDCALV